MYRARRIKEEIFTKSAQKSYTFLYTLVTVPPTFDTVRWSCNLVFARSNGNTQHVPTDPAIAPFKSFVQKL